jgi:hypothetical protein
VPLHCGQYGLKALPFFPRPEMHLIAISAEDE